jgi:hypothetical protein
MSQRSGTIRQHDWNRRALLQSNSILGAKLGTDYVPFGTAVNEDLGGTAIDRSDESE